MRTHLKPSQQLHSDGQLMFWLKLKLLLLDRALSNRQQSKSSGEGLEGVKWYGILNCLKPRS